MRVSAASSVVTSLSRLIERLELGQDYRLKPNLAGSSSPWWGKKTLFPVVRGVMVDKTEIWTRHFSLPNASPIEIKSLSAIGRGMHMCIPGLGLAWQMKDN